MAAGLSDPLALSPAAGALQQRVTDWAKRFAEAFFSSPVDRGALAAVLDEVHANASPLELLTLVHAIQARAGIPDSVRQRMLIAILNHFGRIELPSDCLTRKESI